VKQKQESVSEYSFVFGERGQLKLGAFEILSGIILADSRGA